MNMDARSTSAVNAAHFAAEAHSNAEIVTWHSAEAYAAAGSAWIVAHNLAKPSTGAATLARHKDGLT